MMKRYVIHVRRPVNLVSEITVEAETLHLARNFVLQRDTKEFDWRVTPNSDRGHLIDHIEEVFTEEVTDGV